MVSLPIMHGCQLSYGWQPYYHLPHVPNPRYALRAKMAAPASFLLLTRCKMY
jgi:hypothetical protein